MSSLARSRATRTSLLVLGAAVVYPAIAMGQDPAPPQPSPPPSAPAPSEPAPVDVEDSGDDDIVDVPDTPPPPAPEDKGVVTGTVVEDGSGEEVIEAQISVVGTQVKTLSDLDGKFRLELPPGTYELRVFYEGHKPRRVQKVVVTKGQSQSIEVKLELDSVTEDPVVEIEVKADRTNAATQLLIRKNAVNVGDSVSAQEIAKTPDRNAAEAAKRVVGATILDGRFVLVRGLGERYTNALLNGSPLPSPEPDRQAVPLDLFPSLVLSDISILKTFSPDMPGDFAGGSVSIHTRQPSEEFQIAATLSIGANTNTTFGDRLSYTGGSLDFLGIDSGRRSLPKQFPSYRLANNGVKPDGSVVTDQEINDAGRSVNSSMATNRSLAPPNHGFNVVGGGTVPVGALGQLGITGALTYSRSFSTIRDAIYRRFFFAIDPNEPNKPFPYAASVDSRGEIGNDRVSWGGLVVASLQASEDHRVTLTALTSRSSDNETRILTGPNAGAGFNVLEDTRLRFLSRGLFFGELAGEHKVRKWKGTEIGWRVSGSLATLDEPDTRQTSYIVQEDGSGNVSKFWNSTPTLSGQHFYGAQSERSIGGALDITQPILEGKTPLKAKGGVFVQARERDFAARRFHFRQRPVPFTEYLRPADELFADDNIGTLVNFNEWTQGTDSYVASQSLYAGYLMADFSPMSWLRLVGGARIEAWSQNLASFDRFLPDQKAESGQDTLNVLPALSLVFKTTKDSNLRASISQTVSRPQLRELAPFLFTDYVGARDQVGNPSLKVSSVVNADIRMEVFPKDADVIAVSAFYKEFQDPIEAIILGGSSNELLTYSNAKGAYVLGMEVEVRKNLSFVSPWLANVSPLANLTISQSRVVLDPEQGGIQTSNVRPLVGQSPFVLNLGIDYANETSGTRGRIVYNVAAPRIRAAGSNSLLDTYEQPRHLLDLSVAQRIGEHLDLKLTAANLLQAPFRVTFGNVNDDERVVQEQNPGTTVTLSATVTN